MIEALRVGDVDSAPLSARFFCVISIYMGCVCMWHLFLYLENNNDSNQQTATSLGIRILDAHWRQDTFIPFKLRKDEKKKLVMSVDVKFIFNHLWHRCSILAEYK